MKRNLLFILCLIMYSVITAQTFVSTTAENKNVVLEEFTGIHCGFCPDGHVVAQGIYNQNPGDVVLMNIHTGSYATPAAGEPDFRTPFGDMIDNQAGVSGYPAGTVNRHQFTMSQGGGTAMSRGDWSSASLQILSQPSYINVAAQSTLDISSRVLTVVVEAYYTGTPTSTGPNSLNVALLQNNVAGPQSGAANWNPGSIIPGPWNPTYNHQHMLRHLLTGQWGESIPISSGLYTNTFTYTIPSDLNGVPYDLFNLDVAVFIAEGQQEIITGEMSAMTHIVPPGINLIDLSANTNMSMPSSYCDNILTPEITVTNNSNIAVDTFEVGYTLNSNPTVSQTVYTSLAAGTSTTITFPTITVPSGTNNISFSSSTLSGTSYIDNIAGNNIATTGDFSVLSPTAIGTNHTEGFEGYALATPAPNNAILIEDNGNWVGVIDPTYTSGLPVGGFGNSPNAYRWRFGAGTEFNPGEYGVLMFDKLDFSNTINNRIEFSFSHANRQSWDVDRLQILVSLDCGNTWTVVDEISGTNLHTASILWPSNNFYPSSQDWSSTSINLNAYDGENDISIGIKGIFGGGNNLYVDDISITGATGPTESWDCVNGSCIDPGTGSGQYNSLNSCQSVCNSTSVDEQSSESLSVYPNPVKNILNIQGIFESVKIYDMFSKLVLTSTKNSIDTENLSDGIYMINITTKNMVITKKIIITK